MFLNPIVDSSLVYILIYIVTYNITIASLIWILIFAYGSDINSSFSFNQLSSSLVHKIWLSTVLLSLAGLPPFMGFTTKILVLSVFASSTSLSAFVLIFSIIMLFLFLYIKNIKTLFTESKPMPPITSSSFLNKNSFFSSVNSACSFFLLINIFVMDDVLSVALLFL